MATNLIHATVAGLNVYGTDVVFPAEGGVNGLVFTRRAGCEPLRYWLTKAGAVKAAREIDWPSSSIQQGQWAGNFRTLKIWVIGCPEGGFLTGAGYDRIKAATHRTYVYDVSAPGLAASGWSKRTRNSANQRDIKWGCEDCGENGYGTANTRATAKVAGDRHRAEKAIGETN